MTQQTKSWYIFNPSETQKGPISEELLIFMQKEGSIDQSTLIWTEGMAQWLPFSQVFEPSLQNIHSKLGEANLSKNNDEFLGKNLSKWSTQPLLLSIRWISFLPFGLLLHHIWLTLFVLVYIWSTSNTLKLLLAYLLLAGTPILALMISGAFAYIISIWTTMICPLPRIGAVIYLFFYAVYMMNQGAFYLLHKKLNPWISGLVFLSQIIGGLIPLIRIGFKTDLNKR